jgi:hypothetical protein
MRRPPAMMTLLLPCALLCASESASLPNDERLAAVVDGECPQRRNGRTYQIVTQK